MAKGRVVDVNEASRLVECSQTERHHRFQQLVRHYLSQILHGCKSAYCTTPSCLTSSRRNTSRPVRPPTQLTARILAHYLASQDSPRQGLCPHELKVPPNAIEIEGVAGPSIRQGNNGAEREFLVYPPIWRLAERRRRVDNGIYAMEDAQMADAVRSRRQARKDVKSLGQNLYDSATMIYNCSKQIPSPESVFALLRASSELPEHDTHSHVKKSLAHPRGIARQHAQENLRAHTVPFHMKAAPEFLSNGSQLHRIPYQLPSSSAQSRLPKSADTSVLGGIADISRLPMKQRHKNNSTIGGEGKPAPLQQKRSPVIVSDREQSINQSSRKGKLPLPVIPTLNCHVLDELKKDGDRPGDRPDNKAPNNGGRVAHYDASYRFRPSKPFVNRSLFYTLSNPETLLKSFHDNSEAFKDSPLSHLDSSRLIHSFRDWHRQNGALIFDSLWIAVEALFTPPPELDVQKSPRLRPSPKSAFKDSTVDYVSDGCTATASFSRYLSNHEAAHLVFICIHALTSLVSVSAAHIWAPIRKLRSFGVIIPNLAPNTEAYSHAYLDVVDELEYEPATRLADRLLRAIGARTCFEHILATLSRNESQQGNSKRASIDVMLIDIIIQHLQVIEGIAINEKEKVGFSHVSSDDPGWTVTATFMEWLRTVIIKNWDNKAEINKWGHVGTAVILLDKLHANREALNLRPEMFEMPFFNERLDPVEEPLKFLDWSEQPNTVHILQYPNLFPTQHLVAYFRTLNFTNMMSQYENTARVHQMQRSLDMFLREPYWWVIKYRMKVILSDYLVLDISRENPLKDTLDQLWGQEKRMLLKPLKVKMGHQEGEVGLDHGGVTNEFFRIVLSEAFKPDNGMFVLNAQTRMTWFQPRTLEPSWKFEMLGLLFSLAIYNGITLPVTFPLALYHFLLPLDSPFRNREAKVDTLDYIRDGWPGLAKAFGDLLTWCDGDVRDVMMREYAFSFEAFGRRIDHDMAHPYGHNKPESDFPHSPVLEQGEIPMVTNENREQFVRDYIHHLTYLSVEPQLKAFLEGFLACINPKSLHLFTPSTLRDLVEGTQHISVPDLRRCTKYEDGYSATHPTIVDFWSIVENYSQQDRQRLLEFVTASDRIPITGYESITFHIVRLGGETESLPTSSTCFGKLYLPEYKDKPTLSRKLELALQNSQGFGVV